MAYPFQRTLRSLHGDASGTRSTLLLLSALALAALASWATFAQVPLLKVSTRGRIEPPNAVHRIEPASGGLVLRSMLELDKEVEEGELLIEFDSREQQLELAQSEATAAALTEDLALLREQLANKSTELVATARADEAALHEANARETELAPRRALAEQRERLAKASPIGSVSELEKLERQTEAEALARATRTQALGIARLQREQQLRREALRAELLALEREQLKLEGQRGELKITIARLRHQIEQKHVRATASGRLVDVVELGSGAFIPQGQRLGTIVAGGPELVRVRARFPKETVGIIRPGQSAQLKLDSYPWSIYGTVPARVSRVGTEPGLVATPEAIPGTVRVELVLLPQADRRISVQHGLTAIVEVEVARVSPLALLMRAIGEWEQPAPEPATEPQDRDNDIAQAEAR